MALKIRLARFGCKGQPFYRIVVANSECRRDGRHIEIVGTYNPMVAENKAAFKDERVKHWVSLGAKPTERVFRLYTQYCGDFLKETQVDQTKRVQAARRKRKERNKARAAS